MKRKRILEKLSLLTIVSILVFSTSPLATASPKKSSEPAKLTVAVSAEPDVLNQTFSSFKPGCYTVLTNICEAVLPSLYLVNRGESTATEGLAESWKISDDGKTLGIRLRKGVTFSNGDPLTTKDVVFTFELAKKNDHDFFNKDTFDGYDIIDDYNIVFHLNKSSILTLNTFAQLIYVQSKAYYDRVGEKKFIDNPIGTGPYKLVEYKPGQYADLEANENYWGGAPEVKQVRFVFAADDGTRVSMLKSGEVDMITDTPWQVVKSLEDNGYKTEYLESVPGMAIQFGLINPNTPWTDLRVRQAINYAIDKQSLINVLFGGIPRHDAWLGPDEPGYDPTLKPYPYDPEKAKTLLAEAGYADGFDMPLNYMVGGPIPGMKDVVDYVTASLKKVKINCKPIPMEGSTGMQLIEKAHSDPTIELVMLSTHGSSNAVDSALSLDGWQSYFFMAIYVNPELDPIVDAALAKVADPEKRAELVKEAYKILDADLPMINILTNINVYTMRPNIQFKPSIVVFRLVEAKNARVLK